MNSRCEFAQSPGETPPGLYFWGKCFACKSKWTVSPLESLTFAVGMALNRTAFPKQGEMMRYLRNTRRLIAKRLFRNAASMAGFVILSACASVSYQEYAAYGYLTPGPTGEPELIGVFDSIGECEAAGEGWASRQVVGNPVFTECLPVDRN